jgi:hypothetical protein
MCLEAVDFWLNNSFKGFKEMKLILNKDDCNHQRGSKYIEGEGGFTFLVPICKKCGRYPMEPYYAFIDDPETKDIRSQLNIEDIEYKVCKKIKKLLHEKAKKTYVKLFKDDKYLEFISNNLPNFKIEPEEENYYMEMFCDKTQHIYADSFYQLLDLAILNISLQDKKEFKC